MGITCRHVVAQYRERRERESNLLFQIGGVELDPLAQLIDEDEALDIATIGLSNEQVEKITLVQHPFCKSGGDEFAIYGRAER